MNPTTGKSKNEMVLLTIRASGISKKKTCYMQKQTAPPLQSDSRRNYSYQSNELVILMNQVTGTSKNKINWFF